MGLLYRAGGGNEPRYPYFSHSPLERSDMDSESSAVAGRARRVVKRTTSRAVLITVLGLTGCSPLGPSSEVPDVQGQWRGTYLAPSCSEFLSAVGVFCGVFNEGGSVTLILNQSGPALTGTLEIGTLEMGSASLAVTGSVGSDKLVVLAGTGTLIEGTTVRLNTWRTAVHGAALAGIFTFTVVTGPPATSGLGSVTVSAPLREMVKSSLNSRLSRLMSS